MSTETTLTPADETTTVLVAALAQSGLTTEQAATLNVAFSPFYAQAFELVRAAAGITVTDATQVTEMAAARKARLAIAKVRTSADKEREKQKSRALMEGRAVQACYNELANIIAPVEQKLEEAEKFAERAEAARKAEIKLAREALLKPYGEFQIGDMDSAQFAALLAGAKAQHEARLAEDKRLETEHVAKEKADADERARLALENQRMHLLTPLGATVPEKLGELSNDDWLACLATAKQQKIDREERMKLDKVRSDALYAVGVKSSASLGELPAPDWDLYYAPHKAAHEKKLADEAAEKKRRDDENARLKKEKDDADAKAKATKEKADADAKAIKDAADELVAENNRKAEADRVAAKKVADEAKVEADKKAAALQKQIDDAKAAQKVKDDAEAKRVADIALAAKKAAAAPDREKLMAFAQKISDLPIPNITDDALTEEISSRINDLVEFIQAEAKDL